MSIMHGWASSEITIHKHKTTSPLITYMLYCEAEPVYILSACDWLCTVKTWFDLRNNEIWCFALRKGKYVDKLNSNRLLQVRTSLLAWKFVHAAVLLCVFPGITVHLWVCVCLCMGVLVLYDLELYGFTRFSPHANLQAVFQCYVASSCTVEVTRIVCGDLNIETWHTHHMVHFCKLWAVQSKSDDAFFAYSCLRVWVPAFGSLFLKANTVRTEKHKVRNLNCTAG